MPIYEYRCRDCGATFEVLVRHGATATCPRCSSSSLDKLISAPLVLSDKMARQTGHTCCGRGERCATPPCSEGSACWRG